MQPWTGDSATRISPAGGSFHSARGSKPSGGPSPLRASLRCSRNPRGREPAGDGGHNPSSRGAGCDQHMSGSVGAGGRKPRLPRPQMTDSQARAARILDVLIVRARLARGLVPGLRTFRVLPASVQNLVGVQNSPVEGAGPAPGESGGVTRSGRATALGACHPRGLRARPLQGVRIRRAVVGPGFVSSSRASTLRGGRRSPAGGEELRQVVERVRPGELRGRDQAHEQVAHRGAVLRLVEEGIFPVQDRALEHPLHHVGVERRPGLPQEERQPVPALRQYSIALPRPEFVSVFFASIRSSIHRFSRLMTGPLFSWWKRSRSAGDIPSAFVRSSFL